MRHRIALGALAALAALTFAATAFAHAEVSPPTALARSRATCTRSPCRPRRKRNDDVDRADAARRVLDRLVRAFARLEAHRADDGLRRGGSRHKVTWTGGSVPTGEDAAFSFLGAAPSPGTYTFCVRQTYSDGSVVDWTGPESVRHAGAGHRRRSRRSAAADVDARDRRARARRDRPRRLLSSASSPAAAGRSHDREARTRVPWPLGAGVAIACRSSRRRLL